MEERAEEVDVETEVEGEEERLVERPARDETRHHDHLRLEDVAPHASVAVLALRRLAAQLADVERRDGPVQRAVHRRVAEEEDERRQDVDEESGEQPVSQHLRVARVGDGAEATAAGVQPRAVQQDDKEHAPRHQAGELHPPLRAHVTVDDREEHSRVALDGNRDEVVRRRDERAPQRVRTVPHPAQHLVDETLKIAALRPHRFDRYRHHHHRREEIERALVYDQDVHAPLCHRRLLQDDHDHE